jgi:hypothetical protein
LNAKNEQELTKKLRFHVARFLSGRTYATKAVKLLSKKSTYTAMSQSIALCPHMLWSKSKVHKTASMGATRMLLG